MAALSWLSFIYITDNFKIMAIYATVLLASAVLTSDLYQRYLRTRKLHENKDKYIDINHLVFYASNLIGYKDNENDWDELKSFGLEQQKSFPYSHLIVNRNSSIAREYLDETGGALKEVLDKICDNVSQSETEFSLTKEVIISHINQIIDKYGFYGWILVDILHNLHEPDSQKLLVGLCKSWLNNNSISSNHLHKLVKKFPKRVNGSKENLSCLWTNCVEQNLLEEASLKNSTSKEQIQLQLVAHITSELFSGLSCQKYLPYSAVIILLEKYFYTPRNYSWAMPILALDHYVQIDGSTPLKQIDFVLSAQTEQNDGSFNQNLGFAYLIEGWKQYYGFDCNIDLNWWFDSTFSLKTNVSKEQKTDRKLFVATCESIINSPTATYNKMEGVEFEDFEELYSATDQIITKYQDIYKESKTAIDFTSGQKITSVVATMYSTTTKIKSQMVSTNSYRLKMYDFAYSDSQALSG